MIYCYFLAEAANDSNTATVASSYSKGDGTEERKHKKKHKKRSSKHGNSESSKHSDGEKTTDKSYYIIIISLFLYLSLYLYRKSDDGNYQQTSSLSVTGGQQLAGGAGLTQT
jgi:hypothetical protein